MEKSRQKPWMLESPNTNMLNFIKRKYAHNKKNDNKSRKQNRNYNTKKFNE